MKQQIEVLISATGGVTIEAVGFTGGACEQATQALEEALGLARTKQRKPEFFRKRSNTQTQKLGQ